MVARHVLHEDDVTGQDRAALTDLCEPADKINTVRRESVEERSDKIVSEVAVLCENPDENAAIPARLRQVLGIEPRV